MLTPIRLRVRRVHRVLGVDEGADAAAALRLGDHVVDERRLARRLRAEDLDDAAARQPADAEREVERERARRDGADRHRGPVAHLHHRALAELPLDLPERDVECLFAIHRISLLDSETTFENLVPRPGRAQTGQVSSSVGRHERPELRAAPARSRGRSRKRSTVTCGSHGRASRGRRRAPRAARADRARARVARRPRRRGRACRRSASRGSARRRERGGSTPAAAARSASTTPSSSPAGRRAEEGERDVEVLARDDAAAATGSPTLPRDEAVERRRAGGERRRAGGAHRLRRYRRRSYVFVHGSASRAPHEMQRRDRRAARGSSSRSPGKSTRAPRAPSGPSACRYTSPTGFSGVPPPGPATPVTDTATSAPSRSRTPSAIAAAISAETAPCSSSSSAGHAELARP